MNESGKTMNHKWWCHLIWVIWYDVIPRLIELFCDEAIIMPFLFETSDFWKNYFKNFSHAMRICFNRVNWLMKSMTLDQIFWITFKLSWMTINGLLLKLFMIRYEPEICVGNIMYVFVGSKKLGTWVDRFGRFIGQIQNALFRWKNFKNEIENLQGKWLKFCLNDRFWKNYRIKLSYFYHIVIMFG